jgi:hypothetical protein
MPKLDARNALGLVFSQDVSRPAFPSTGAQCAQMAARTGYTSWPDASAAQLMPSSASLRTAAGSFRPDLAKPFQRCDDAPERRRDAAQSEDDR